MSNYSEEIEEFNKAIGPIGNLSFVVRDSGLQRAALGELSTLRAKVGGWKAKAIAEQDEDHSNIFLGCEYLVEALRAQLEMWLCLKDDEPDEAWRQLVFAQMATRDAMRSHRGFSHLEAQAARLINIERVVFPKQTFFSAGLIVGRRQCTICGAEYDDCPHITGMPYMGRLCSVRLQDVTPDHVAIVSEPANKQCRVVEVGVEGGRLNQMTGLVKPGALTEGNAGAGLDAHGIIATAAEFNSK